MKLNPNTLSARIMLTTLCVLLLASCAPWKNTLPELDETTGKPFGAFPAGTPDEEISKAARDHLDSTVNDDGLFAFIYFNKLIPLAQVETMAAEYDLHGDKTWGVATGVFDEEVRVGIPLDTSTITATAIEAYLNEIDLEDVVVEIAALSVWAKPDDLKRLWDEQDVIRVIGIGGKNGNVLGSWLPIIPSEPLR